MDISKMKPDYDFKYIFIGNTFVGKTPIIYRIENGKFREEQSYTINMDYTHKIIKLKDKIYKIQLQDTTGQEEFKSVSRGYYKRSVCAIIVYDITDRDSFNSVSDWIEEAKTNGPSSITLALVGNKSDLEDKRQITYEEGEELAQRNSMIFFETSALNGKNVDKMFYTITESIIKKIEEGYYKGKKMKAV